MLGLCIYSTLYHVPLLMDGTRWLVVPAKTAVDL